MTCPLGSTTCINGLKPVVTSHCADLLDHPSYLVALRFQQFLPRNKERSVAKNLDTVVRSLRWGWNRQQ